MRSIASKIEEAKRMTEAVVAKKEGESNQKREGEVVERSVE